MRRAQQNDVIELRMELHLVVLAAGDEQHLGIVSVQERLDVAHWAMDDNYRTPLITSAIQMAARNVSLTVGAIFHSDRGSNYTSAEFAGELGRLGIRQSVGRTG